MTKSKILPFVVITLNLLVLRVAAKDDMTFPVNSNLQAGVGKVDVTPTEVKNMPVVGHTRTVSGVRDPIRAAVLLLDDGETKAAIVTLDVISAWDALVNKVRDRVYTLTGTPRLNVMVGVSHTHSGPGWEGNRAWQQRVMEGIDRAIKEADSSMRTVSLGYSEDRIEFNINRRRIQNGKSLVSLNPDGPNDQRVKVIRFDDGRSLSPMATIMHAVCHPCFFTWGDNVSQPYPKGYPKMSADFPGEAQHVVERQFGRTKALFLQGCAGDIRPNLAGYPFTSAYRCADEADIQWAGNDLAAAVSRALSRSMIRENLSKRDEFFQIRCATSIVELPGKQGPVKAEFQAMKIGRYMFVTLPGEPFVEVGFQLEEIFKGRVVPIIVGYANGSIGYIPTAESYEYGGYEPNASPLLPEAEFKIYEELENLGDRIIGDVFASYSKHPKDKEKRESEEQERESK